jgi:hypothetical protein
MNPETVMMLCDGVDQIGQFVLWLFLMLAGACVAVLLVAFGISIAIRRTIRYIWRRMAEGSL